MAKRRPIKDPFAEREAAKYENPIPSREFLSDLIVQQGKPLSFSAICRLLDLGDAEQEFAVQKRLNAMVREHQLVRSKRGAFSLADTSQLITGKVIGHREGYGFLQAEDGSDDLYLHNKQMRKAFDGDIVKAFISGIDNRGRREASILEVVKANTHKMVGRLEIKAEFALLWSDNPKVSNSIYVPLDALAGAKEGQYVCVEITQQPQLNRGASGKVIEILGDHLTPGMEIDIALRNYDIPFTWPQAVLDETSHLNDEPNEADKQHRIDLRHLPLVTIDGEDARDFDDAVYCESKRSGGWRLWVAIADVSHYVAPGSALDKEAYQRATSVYFPDHVIPMLPEAISNGLCSLKPQVDRLCMVCEMTISAQGRLSGYQFYEAVMHSHARLTYTQVSAMLASDTAEETNAEQEQAARWCQQYANILPALKTFKSLYTALATQRQQRGAIEFETVETQILFDAERKIEKIIPRQRNIAHRMIEEAMLCANISAARFVQSQKLPALYRVHEGPASKKLESLRQYLVELGLDLKGGTQPKPDDYQQLMIQIEGRDDQHIIQTMLLRSMNQAVYQPNNKGHFGLAFPAYAHFTSPIRRYPDLLIHRAIRSVIRSAVASNKVRKVEGAKTLTSKQAYPYQLEDMLVLGEHCSLCERRADDATRDVNSWLKCEYLSHKIGDKFNGTISAVTGFGLFVELDELYVEGLIHISNLPQDFFHYDASKQRLVGEHSRQVFQLGGKVCIQIAAVNLDERKVDLSLLSSETPAKRARKRPADKKLKKEQKKSPKKAGLKSKASDKKKTKKSNEKKNRKPKSKAAKTRKETSKKDKTKKSRKKKKA